MPQVSAVYGSWQNPSALRGVPALSAMQGSGMNGNASASCLFAEGSHDGDKILYQDAYTLTFTYAAFLRQTSETVDDPDLVQSATAEARNLTNATGMESAALRVRASRMFTFGIVLWILCWFAFMHQSMQLGML